MADIILTPGPYDGSSQRFVRLPTVPQYGNATAEIGTLTQTQNIPCTGEIAAQDGVGVCTAEITVEAPAPPEDVLGVHLNQGRVLLTWKHDEPARVEYYEAYVSINGSTGQFHPYPGGRFVGFFGFLNNLPIGSTVWIQLRAVGKNQLPSAFSSVKRGKFQPIEGLLRVTAPAGSVIVAGTEFSTLHPVTQLPIVFSSRNTITIN